MRSSQVTPICGIGFALLGLVGCKTAGPISVPNDRFNYNEAIAASSDQQLLLNLVRIRYGETPRLLEVASVLNQYTIEAGGGFQYFGTDIDVWSSAYRRALYGIDSDPSLTRTYNVDVRYVDRPTITYQPIQGEDFVNRMMKPISLSTVLFLAQSGWEMDLLTLMCVQRVNDLPNTPIDHRPWVDDELYAKFRRAASIMRDLQKSERFTSTLGDSPDTQGVILKRKTDDDAAPLPQEREFEELLGIEHGAETIRLNAGYRRWGTNEITLQMRSPLAIMTALAREFEPPTLHELEGRVIPGYDLGEEARGDRLLTIKSSRTPPLTPFASIFYRGVWFYIDDRDLESKRTFALLTYIMSLQSTGAGSVAPLLTVPAGG